MTEDELAAMERSANWLNMPGVLDLVAEVRRLRAGLEAIASLEVWEIDGPVYAQEILDGGTT